MRGSRRRIRFYPSFSELEQHSALAGDLVEHQKSATADPKPYDIQTRGDDEVVYPDDMLHEHRAHAVEDIRRGNYGAKILHPSRQNAGGVIDATKWRQRKNHGPCESLRSKAVTQHKSRHEQADAPPEGNQNGKECHQRDSQRIERKPEKPDGEQSRGKQTDDGSHQAYD